MSPTAHKATGFWGTFRSYLVAGSVLSVLAGVLGLIPAVLMIMLVQSPGAGDRPVTWGLLSTALSFPVICFAAPPVAYAFYKAHRNGVAIAALLAPLAAGVVFSIFWFQVDEFCGGRLLC